MIPFLEKAFNSIRQQLCNDGYDKLSYYYSVLILLFFALVVSMKQFNGEPMQCMSPSEFKSDWTKYVETYCFIQHTYFVSFEETSLSNNVKHNSRKINYYQWVPFILVIQAAMFYIPSCFWALSRSFASINVNLILENAIEVNVIDPEKRETLVQNISSYMRKCFKLGRSSCKVPFLSVLYFITKMLYLTNVILQVIFLTHFMGGKEVFNHLRMGNESIHFPKISYCDLNLRVLGNVHTHTVQCLLTINTLNERIFIFLWFWCILVATGALINFIYWVITYISYSCTLRIFRNYLHTSDSEIVKKFLFQYLRCDGILILRFINTHTDKTVVSELITKLFNDYADEEPEISNYYSE